MGLVSPKSDWKALKTVNTVQIPQPLISFSNRQIRKMLKYVVPISDTLLLTVQMSHLSSPSSAIVEGDPTDRPVVTGARAATVSGDGHLKAVRGKWDKGGTSWCRAARVQGI